VQTGGRVLALQQRIYHLVRDHCRLPAEAHQADYATGGTHGSHVALEGIDPDEKVAGKNYFDGIVPLAAPAAPDPDARQIDMKVLAQEVFFRNRFLAGFAADGIPERP
jgi:hypothetical protein